MTIEKVQIEQGVTEWLVRDFEGGAVIGATAGDLVSAFAPDGSLTVGVVRPDGSLLVSAVAN